MEDVPAQPDAFDEVIQRARQGEQAAFIEIMERFEGKALMIARGMGASSHDAEDIVQDVFIKLFRYIRSYRSGRSFINWFYRIVVNASRDHLRRMSRAGEPMAEEDIAESVDHSPASEAQVLSFGPTAVSGHEASDAAEDLRRAMAGLSERERIVVILRDLQGLSAWEIARILRISPITVRRHASRAHERLRIYFRESP
ncbi:MAG TPA: RNA polymerase sigma factor [Candidatus Polarisedimenticolia bacterium]|nr:RNA polymerase sigma factor [Candidatus Polarisedimenticolia bacterium]